MSDYELNHECTCKKPDDFYLHEDNIYCGLCNGFVVEEPDFKYLKSNQ